MNPTILHVDGIRSAGGGSRHTCRSDTRVGVTRPGGDGQAAPRGDADQFGRLPQPALVLGNVHNYAAHYREKGEAFEVDIVVFGPGYGMVRADMSMMKGQIETLQKDLGGSLKILAGQNTRRAIAESEGKQPEDIPLLLGMYATPSGVDALAELQEAR